MKFNTKLVSISILFLFCIIPMGTAVSTGVAVEDEYTWNLSLEGASENYEGSLELQFVVRVTDVADDVITGDMDWIFISATGDYAEYYADYEEGEVSDTTEDSTWDLSDDYCAEDSYFFNFFISADCESLSHSDTDTYGDYSEDWSIEYNADGVLQSYSMQEEDSSDPDYFFTIEVTLAGIPSFPIVMLSVFSVIAVIGLIIKQRK